MNNRDYTLLLRLVRRLTNELRTLREEIHAIAQDRRSRENAPNNQPVQPLPVVIAHPPQLDPARREYYEAENQERNSQWRRVKPLVETVGVIVALSLAGFNLLTLLEIRKQTPSVIKSADAAKSAANTANDTLTITKELTEGTNEAVCYITVDCRRSSEDGTCRVTFVNIGHVAAKTVRTHVEFSLRRLPSNIQVGRSDRFNFNQEEMVPRIAGNAMYAPGHGDIDVPIKVPMLRSHKLEIESGKKALMASATMSYDNGFGSTRNTAYCQETVYGRTGAPSPPNRVPMIIPCEGPYGMASFIEEQRKINGAAQQQNPNQKQAR